MVAERLLFCSRCHVGDTDIVEEGGGAERPDEGSERPARELVMRIVVVIGVVVGGLVLGACSSTSAFVADNLPEWAGGLPQGTPPRRGAPGYEAYLRSLSGDQPANVTQPAAAPSPSRREPKESVDEPIH